MEYFGLDRVFEFQGNGHLSHLLQLANLNIFGSVESDPDLIDSQSHLVVKSLDSMAAHIEVVPFGLLGDLEEEGKTETTFFGDLYKLKLVFLSILLNHNFFELEDASGVVHFEDCKDGLSEDHQKVSLGNVYGIDRLLED